MNSWRLSEAADRDIAEIAEESQQRWGDAHADRYMRSLEETFDRLVAFPALGRDAGHIRTGYHQIESGAHMIFYRRMVWGILIIRVLHRKMLFENHL